MIGVEDIIKTIKNDGIVVMPTDTIFGIIGSALSPTVVKKIETLKNRSDKKPFIILISSVEDVKMFCPTLNTEDEKILSLLWPNKISVVIPCDNAKFEYLHKGEKSLAFRIPEDDNLMKIIKETGPLVAPSANPEGMVPAKNTSEARDYFGNRVDLYIEGPTKDSPSTLISLKNGKIELIREGEISLEAISKKINDRV